ncbi:Uncharacterised protein [Streptomyces griseus]|nr:Uncharacterised protein [Streptomyces griseus]
MDLLGAVDPAEQFGEPAGEVLGVLLAVAERPAYAVGNPTERPSPMSIRPGKSDASTPNCSATTSGRWLGSITPPVPTRMVEVAAATAAASTVGAEPATPGTPWCSETQKR